MCIAEGDKVENNENNVFNLSEFGDRSCLLMLSYFLIVIAVSRLVMYLYIDIGIQCALQVWLFVDRSSKFVHIFVNI